MSLIVAIWSEDSARMANEDVASRMARLRNHLLQITHATTPTFIVFIAAEFLFMHGRSDAKQIRWYSPSERDEALHGLAEASRIFRRTLLVGGSVCWAEQARKGDEKSEWCVHNEAPIHYDGEQLALYGKRHGGGEVLPEDALRLYRQRCGSFEKKMHVRKDKDGADGTPRYRSVRAAGSMGDLAAMAGNTVRRGPGGTLLPAAPGIQKAMDRYQGRYRFAPGNDEPSFGIPDGTFTAGIEICQEHNLAALRSNSTRGAVNFHLLVSNTVGHLQASENLLSPGFFIHAKAGSAPELVILDGAHRTAVAADQWTQLGPHLHYIALDMPEGL